MSKVRYEHCILKVNIARYQKQKTTTIHQGAPRFNPPRRPPQTLATNTVNWHPIHTNRTFADAVAGAHSHNHKPASRPIAITPSGYTRGWDDCVMIGEPVSLQHIADLPALLPLDGNPSGQVYYIGGTNVLVKFINKESAKTFYNNEHNWNRWFKWLKPGFNDDLPQERLAWLKVFGLPLRFRSEENFERIANNFGKTLQTGNHDWSRFDLSEGKICILTKHNKFINEEVEVVFNNTSYRVGIVEFDRDWKPYDQPTLRAQESFVDKNMEDTYDDEEDNENCDDDEEDTQDDEDEDVDDAPESDYDEHIQIDDTLEEGEIVVESTVEVSIPSKVSEVHTPEKASETVHDTLVNHTIVINAEVESSPIINETSAYEKETAHPRMQSSEQIRVEKHPATWPNKTCEPIREDDWPNSPDPNPNPNPNPVNEHADPNTALEFGKGTLHDKRRRFHRPGGPFNLAQSLQPIAYPWEKYPAPKTITSAPQFGRFDLNNPASSSSSRHEPVTEVFEDSKTTQLSKRLEAMVEARTRLVNELSKSQHKGVRGIAQNRMVKKTQKLTKAGLHLLTRDKSNRFKIHKLQNCVGQR
ncbi:hypothetical protein LXL04_037932 [Taraxacum kok-saghyz]